MTGVSRTSEDGPALTGRGCQPDDFEITAARDPDFNIMETPMIPPEDHMWLWALKGYVGLHSLIKKWVGQGMPVTPVLVEGLKQVHKDVGDLIDAVQNSKTGQ